MRLSRVIALKLAGKLRIPMRGYEVLIEADPKMTPKLRIPMRGYEIDMIKNQVVALIVTNPHAGL